MLSGAEQVVLEEELVPAFREMLDMGAPRTDPAELERLAATLLVPLELPGMPPAVAEAFVGEIERRGDEDAAGVLAALAVLASGETAVAARASLERLAGGGVTSSLTPRLGTATVREATRIAADGAELLVLVLGRPGTRRLQVAMLGIELEETAGALVECVLTPPLPAREARSMLAEALAGGGTPEPIGIEALAARVAAAAQRAKDLGVALGPEAALAMPVLGRALTGDPAGLPRPETVPPWEDDDPELIVDAAEDESGFHELIDRLLNELEEWARASCPPEGPMWRSGDFVASAMLEWKGGYGDGRLGRWTGEDLAEFLLDYFPRKVSVHEETVEDVVDCVISFLAFLDQRESLSGEPLEVLEEACDELRAEFLTAQADPGSWGLAKSMFMQMHAEGVDPEDPAAIEGWMADFNERPRAERDAVIGGAADRMLAEAGPPDRKRPKKSAQQQRKSQRAARKRNRRR
ncbi:MAG TPA: hypothetical protein VFR49_01690 [Solirubrobacteraceae bacterium]|nr:hypothetical protein [Solirubrobacteraceae bacterium]